MFIDKVISRANQINSRLCIGLDPHYKIITKQLGFSSVFKFNQAIVDATYDLALCYKPQIAHYSACSLEKDLEQTIEYIHNKDDNLTVILDAKRGDIGSTAEYYAREAFSRFNADATTVNPYLGAESIKPFLSDPTKGVIALIRTSNPSSADIQCQLIGHEPLYQYIAKLLIKETADNPNLLFVMGATDTEAIQRIRSDFLNHWFLVPGIGAQGGSLTDTIKAGGTNLIINATRSVIYPQWDGKGDYFEQVRNAATKLHQQINSLISRS